MGGKVKMPTRRQLIQKIELNSDQSSVTFSGIPQNYTDLKIVWSARSNRAAYEDTTNIRFNGDSGTNYSYKMLYQYNNSVTSENGTSQTGSRNTSTLVATSSTASTFGSAEAYIPNYTSSNAKSVSSRGNSENNATQSIVGINSSLWNSTASITSIVMTPWFGTLFIAGSTFYLYGITHVPIIRGGEEYVLDGFKYHKFTSTAALQVIEPGDVELAVQGGGGAGSGGISGVNYGAAGAGGNNYSNKARITQGIMTVTVGAGGAGAANVDGTSGTASSIGSIISMAGGGFGQVNGDYGGSNAIYSGGYNNGYYGGGGAGAGGSASGGSPGVGVLNFDGIRRGGGGGANTSHTGITYGVDGGGTGWGGSYTGTDRPSPNGENQRGGGGAGTLGSYTPNGGSGIVIIRYPYDGN